MIRVSIEKERQEFIDIVNNKLKDAKQPDSIIASIERNLLGVIPHEIQIVDLSEVPERDEPPYQAYTMSRAKHWNEVEKGVWTTVECVAHTEDASNNFYRAITGKYPYRYSDETLDNVHDEDME